MTLTMDFTNMMAAALGEDNGISDAEWKNASSQFAAAHKSVSDLRSDGTLGFLDLPSDEKMLARVLEVAGENSASYDDVLLLGIGGSALGPVALRSALKPHAWNSLSKNEREGFPRLHVLDNVDPATISATLNRVDLSRALVLVVSKSGGTVETMAQYLIVRSALMNLMSDSEARKRFVFVTDPKNGALRKIAQNEGITTLEIPPNVGGRFSVLSPVGLFPAALIGIDVRQMLAGAADATQRSETPELSSNIAGVFAVLQWLSDTRHGRHINVLMPYGDALRDIASWFVQLWAESLGKIRPDGSHAGPTPLSASGATDQHSQVQLFMEGPLDKTVTFVAVRDREQEAKIPSLHSDIPELGYLGGHSLGELLDIERRATAGALAARGRFNATITIDRGDAWHLGALIQTLEIATAYAGALYGVNAFNQPGVELGKNFAYAMLGRPGSDEARKEWDALPKPDPKYQL